MNSLYFLVLLIPAVFAVDCRDKPDGVYEKGCKSFVVCKSGVATFKDCPVYQVFNVKTKQCQSSISLLKTGDLCATKEHCENRPDGGQPDISEKCHTYYTCKGGTYFGHNFCPASLVYNNASQRCDWASNTNPPCGTKDI